MSTEEQLRALLQHAAEDVVPRGDGLAVIRERIAARRSWRRFLVPVAALAGVIGVAAAGAFTVHLTSDSALDSRPATSAPSVVPTAAPQPTAAPSGTACQGAGADALCPTPDPTPPLPTGTTTSAPGTPTWPFTTDAEALDWQRNPAARPWAGDAAAVSRHLLSDLLGLGVVTTSPVQRAGGEARVTVSVGSRVVGTVVLVQVGRDGVLPWSVINVRTPSITTDAPQPGDVVTTPLTVSGTTTDYHQSIRVRLVTASGATLTDRPVMAGPEQPWQVRISWTNVTWTAGMIVSSTRSDKDGSLSAIALVPVRRTSLASGGPPIAGASFVALSNGYVVLRDAVDGRQLRQLSYPPAGSVDNWPARGGTDAVVWVRTRGCRSQVLRTGLAFGPSGVTAEGTNAMVISHLAMSPGGATLAWVEEPCSGSSPGTAAGQVLVVRGPDASEQRTVVAPVGGLDVRDDGSVVLSTADGVSVLSRGATGPAQATPLATTSGCTLTAPAWLGVGVLAWESCPTGVRAVRFASPAYSREAPGPVVATQVATTSVVDDLVLVGLPAGAVARYADGQLQQVPCSACAFPSW